MAVFCLQRRHLDFSSWRGPSERDGSASLLPMSARQRTLSSSKTGLQVCGGKPRFHIRIRLFSAKRKFSRSLVCPRPHSRSPTYLYHVFDHVHEIVGIIVAYVERLRAILAQRIVGKVKGEQPNKTESIVTNKIDIPETTLSAQGTLPTVHRT